MAFEILNDAQQTPHRLHALVRLVGYLRQPTRDQILHLLQPADLKLEEEARVLGRTLYRSAIHCQLIEEQDGGVRLAVDPAQVATVAGFQRIMQERLLSVTDQTAPNYLLNQYAAWYAVQDDAVFRLTRDEFATNFNRDLYGGEDRAFNSTKMTGWQTWATFLGWGWTMPWGNNAQVVVPDARDRLQPLLHLLLPEHEQEVPLARFVSRLGEACPELDGGPLYEQCRQASRGTATRGNQLSLMVSTALRALHAEKQIRLLRRADAADLWRLYPAEGHALNEVTHIQRGKD